MAKIYAKRIHAGLMTWDEVPERWREETKIVYKEMYGENDL